MPAKWQLIRKAGIREDLMSVIMIDIELAYAVINAEGGDKMCDD